MADDHPHNDVQGTAGAWLEAVAGAAVDAGLIGCQLTSPNGVSYFVVRADVLQTYMRTGSLGSPNWHQG